MNKFDLLCRRRLKVCVVSLKVILVRNIIRRHNSEALKERIDFKEQVLILSLVIWTRVLKLVDLLHDFQICLDPRVLVLEYCRFRAFFEDATHECNHILNSITLE